jgi:hypothetical protein
VEKITVFIERVMANKTYEMLIGLVALIAPLYFLKTVYVVWFGPDEVFVGFESESSTWLVLAIVDVVGFLASLPSRRKGRVIQIVMALWSINLFLVYLATIIRHV